MKFKRTIKGAVSVFLVIIMVPMMTVSSLFVDASKVSLAQSVADSAGDLALNTALTSYDTQLKDLYGLFATAQDTTELYTRLEDYYRACITSSGLSVEEANGYVDSLMAQLGQVASDQDVSDILNMELIDFNVSKVTGANYANPTVIKRGIVEFMKYRAPINTGLSFLSSLTSFTTLDKQTELVDKRTEYYEAQQDVMENLKTAWDYINEFNKSAMVTDPNYFTNMQANFDGYENVYKEDIHKKTVMDLYKTQNNLYCEHVVYKAQCNVPDHKGQYTLNNIWFMEHANKINGIYVIEPLNTFVNCYNQGWYNLTYLPTAQEVADLMSNFYYWYRLYKIADDQLDWDNPEPSGTYLLQYFVQRYRKGAVTDYQLGIAGVYNTYQKVRNAMIWIYGHDEDSVTPTANEIFNSPFQMYTTSSSYTETKTINEFYIEINDLYNSEMNETLVNRLTQVSETNIAKTDTTTVNSKVQEIGNAVSGYKDTITVAIDNLEKASTELKAAKTSVESGDLETKRASWESSANSDEVSDSPMAEQDQSELKELKSYLDPAEMQELIDLIDGIVAKLKLALEQIDGYKYQDQYLYMMKSYNDLVSQLETKIGDDTLLNVPTTETDLITEADNLFNWTSGNMDVQWAGEPATDVQLHKANLNFYTYLYQKFNVVGTDYSSTEQKEEDPENGEDLYGNLESTTSTAAGENTSEVTGGTTATENEISSCENLPSAGNAGEAPGTDNTPAGKEAVGETSKNMGDMFTALGEAAVDLGTDIRDNLYVTDYILSMFSYDTIVREYEKKNPGGDSSEITTLTCVPINDTGNYAYGREVEYILFGGSNSENVLKAYASIYGIRLAFNLIYAFTDSSIRDSAFAIATPISAATLGVIPVPLIQAAIIIGLACVESGIDLKDIQDGEAVPLFKTSDTWHCSAQGLLNEAKGLAGDVMQEAVEYVVDEGAKKLGEVLDMTDEQLTAYIQDGGEELTQYIGESYDAIITQNANIAIQKLTTLVSNTINTNVTMPVEDMETYISDQLDAWLAEEEAVSDTSSLAYLAKAQAVAIIKESFIRSAIEAISAATDDVESEVADIAADLETKIADIRSQIINTIVTKPTGKILEYKDQMMEDIHNSIDEGADKLKDTLNEKLDGMFGSGSTSSPTASKGGTKIGNLLAFRYSDYLRLFLLIGLFANQEGILLRTADVIQVNMDMGNPGYLLSNSAAYVQMSATVQVKPTLLALPLFADVEGNPSSNSNWYTIYYNDVKGY